MEFLRQTVDSNSLKEVFALPQSLRNRRVEVIILPVSEEQASTQKKGSAFGCLKKYANPALMQQEEGAWGRAVAEKYADH
jgi:hypothetical protein